MEMLRKLDRQLVDLASCYDGQAEHEAHPFIPSEENIEEILQEVRTLDEVVAQELAGEHDAPAEVVLQHMAEVLETMRVRIHNDISFPHRYPGAITRRLNALTDLDARPPEVRFAALCGVADHAPDVLRAACELGKQVNDERRNMLLNALAIIPSVSERVAASLDEVFSGTAEDSRVQQYADRIARLPRLSEELSVQLRSTPSVSEGEAVTGPEYPKILCGIFGVDMDRLLATYKDEVYRCQEEMREIARAIDPDRDPFTILDEDLPPRDTPEEMYRTIRNSLAIARNAALKYITLPEGETCDVWQVPEYLKDSYPWGGYFSGSDMLSGNLSGAVFLNQYNYDSISLGWIHMNAVHECYPGHHADYVKTSAGNMPRCFKVGSGMVGAGKAAPLAEGIAHRSERLLENIFDEPAFPLFVAYRRLHTAVRIWVDLAMHHFGGTREDGIELYQRFMKFGRDVALGQVVAQEMTPGYFTVYYYGMRELERIQEECGWDDVSFTELIFSCGKVSIETVKRMLRLSDEERRVLLSEFYT
ncbi:MAG: DUF885 family protein [Bacillota bacterium]